MASLKRRDYTNTAAGRSRPLCPLDGRMLDALAGLSFIFIGAAFLTAAYCDYIAEKTEKTRHAKQDQSYQTRPGLRA